MTDPFRQGKPLGRFACSFKEAAQNLGMGPNGAYDLAKAGRLAYVQVSPNRRVVLYDDLAAAKDPSYKPGLLTHAFVGHPWLRLGEMAHTLSVSVSTIRRLVTQGDLPARQDRRNAPLLVSRENLLVFLQERRVPTQRELATAGK